MAQTSLDPRPGDAAPTKTLMEYPGLQSPHPIPHNLLNAPFSKPNVETTRVPPSPSTQSDDSDSVMEETIVCAPFPLPPVNFTQNNPTEPDWHRNTTPATRSISFYEVFQDGKASVKQNIIQFPNSDGSWFILRCDEHDHDFMYPPLRGAAAHLRSKKHGWLQSPSNAVIVEHFGIEVLNCNAELAEKNNSVAFKASQDSMKRSIACIADGMPGRQTLGSEKRPKFTTKACSRTGVDRHRGLKRQSKQRRHEGIPNPSPGRIYLAYWEMTRDWLPALLLPHIGLEEFGVPSTLESLGLIDYIPECYEYDPGTKDLKWKKGYEHGGPRVMEREFAVIYFDGNKFPDGSPADWVRARDLQELEVFDASPRLVSNLKFAKNYLRRRSIEKEADTASESSTALSDIESDSETTSSSCVAGSGSPIISASDGMVPLTEELATEPISQEMEVSLSPGMESETSQPDPQLEHVNRNCCGNALESESGSVSDVGQTTSFDTRSQLTDPEVISISSSEDKMSDDGQPITASEPPSVQIANDTMQIGSDDSTRNNDKSTTQSNDPSTSSVHIHQHHIQRALSNHMAADLLNLKTKSIDLKFPEAIQGLETTQPQLPPVRPPTAQWHARALVPPAQAPKAQTPQVPTAHIPSVNTNVVKRSHLGTLYRSDPGTLYLIRAQSSFRSPVKPPVRVPFPHNIQLQTGEPRFGQPPHEVPPYFLNRLRELTGSQDENPLISAFLTKGLYLCPWCQRKYDRAVSFTDHLVLNHSRSPDPKQGPIVSRAELDPGVDSDVIDLTSGP